MLSACLVVSDSLWPHGWQPARLLCPWDFPNKNTGVGCHFLLQEISLTQESNPCLLCFLHWQENSVPLCHLGSPTYVFSGEYIFTITEISKIVMDGACSLLQQYELFQTFVSINILKIFFWVECNSCYHLQSILHNFIWLIFSQQQSVQSLSHVQLFETQWTAAHQASLSITDSQSLLKFMSIESVMPFTSHPLLSPSPPAFSLPRHQDLF